MPAPRRAADRLSMTARVLVIDDEAPIRRALAQIVRQAGYACDVVATPAAARRRLAAGDVDVALCDLDLKGAFGIEFLRAIGSEHPRTARVVVTWSDDPAVVGEALAAGAAGYVTKPFKTSDIQIALQQALVRREDDDARARAQERREAELRHRADLDPLTGLFNRRRFAEELDRYLRSCSRSGASGALLILDLDHFKVVNDSLGHPAGDDVLRRTARILRERLRSTDVLARLGGDEFAIVLADVSEATAMDVARELQAMLADPSLRPATGASFGVACFSGGGVTLGDDVMGDADAALFDAKEAGRGAVALFSGAKASSLTWVERIRGALADDKLVLHAQPIVDLRSGRVVQEELLVRMLDEDGTLIPPGAFLPTAERFGLIEAIDLSTLGRGLELASAGRSVAVNISAKTMQHDRMIELIEERARTGIDLSLVTIEITETSAISNMDLVRELAQRLSALGCRLALDDFGTGFGTFMYLKHLPIDAIKIDREFVGDLARSRPDQQMIKAMVQIARAAGQVVVAEGIEDVISLDLLRRFGVDHGQGFYLGRPAELSAHTPGLAEGAAQLYGSLREASAA
jgi:diguanylate cyclase (GGDEF)-like protein